MPEEAAFRETPAQLRYEQRPLEPARRSPEAHDEQRGAGKTPFWLRRRAIIVGTALFGLAAYLILHYLVSSAAHQSTDDAFLEAHVVGMAPKISGIVAAVHVKENELVTNGQLLVEIDPHDLQARLAKQTAAVETAQANRRAYAASFELIRTRIETARASERQSLAEAAASRALFERASADFKRIQGLREQRVASVEEFDQARAAAQSAEANLAAAQAKAAADTSRVTEANAQLEAARSLLGTAEGQAAQSAAELRSAELDLSYTKIVAPTAGRITRKAIEPGTYAQIGQRLFALVPPDVWTVANFKETQLRNMRPGQRAQLKLDAYPERPFSGHVESIQAGTGARFSLLPPENAVGNFVKVVQRVPVKIVFDEPLVAGNAPGPGMSVVPTVFVAEPRLSTAAMLIIAIATALLLGGAWWALARRRTNSPNG